MDINDLISLIKLILHKHSINIDDYKDLFMDLENLVTKAEREKE